MDEGLALHQQVPIPFCLFHQYGQVLIQLRNPVSILLPLLDILSIGTLGLLYRMRLVPQLIALITKLALTYAFHMRASYFLLDRLSALGAFSCVVLDP